MHLCIDGADLQVEAGCATFDGLVLAVKPVYGLGAARLVRVGVQRDVTLKDPAKINTAAQTRQSFSVMICGFAVMMNGPLSRSFTFPVMRSTYLPVLRPQTVIRGQNRLQTHASTDRYKSEPIANAGRRSDWRS